MKITLIILVVIAALGFLTYSFVTKRGHVAHAPLNKSFYELSVKSLNGRDDIRFADFKGKKILCVNVASECGFTKQYEGLQKLADTYAGKLVVIGFPCNQFGGQEPGTSEEIGQFCKKNYGVTFPITEKIDVKGDRQHPVYQWLCQKNNNGVDDYQVKWNFNKFLIDEHGNLAGHFGSTVKPESDELKTAITK